MKLPSRPLFLKNVRVKEKPVMAVDTGFDPDSMEGLRLVRASRGTGWFFHAGGLHEWSTRGVLQEEGHLLVWGEVAVLPEGTNPSHWPLDGEEGRVFLKAFVDAWTARSLEAERLPAFSASAVLPILTSAGWSFAFLPSELRSVLDSLQPQEERPSWEQLRHPDREGVASWAFTSAALVVVSASGTLPWAQQDEAHLHQEVRELEKTLVAEELPAGPEPATQDLLFESLTGRGGTVAQWKAWAARTPVAAVPETPERARRGAAALARRQRRRQQGAFWRSRGTLLTGLAVAVLAVAGIVGSVVWGLVKPDPTDTWTAEQVVKGYYAAIDSLDDQQLGKLLSNDSGKQPTLGLDKDEVTNRYVIRQVRTAYEQKSPVLEAAAWEAAGKPPLLLGQMLWGLTDLDLQGGGDRWTVQYQKWTADGGDEKTPPKAVGVAVVDRLILVKTGRGWKISSLQRQTQPLP